MIEPVVGVEEPEHAAATVVFPHPDSPTRPSVSPRLTEKDTPSTATAYCAGRKLTRLAIAWRARNVFTRFWTSSSGPAPFTLTGPPRHGTDRR